MNRLNTAKELLAKRRSQYKLSPEWVAPKEHVEEMLQEVLRLVPTHFNSQGVRMVLLTGDAHRKHWELIEQILIAQIGEDKYLEGTKEKIHGSFMSGVGTVLFFDNEPKTKELMEQFPSYQHNFPKWAEQVQGSHQFATWIGLVGLGFGASLQHYTGMDDEAIRKQVGVPAEWRFIAHMPFGKALDQPAPKDKLPMDELLKVIDK